jgi:hypothetical protein
MPVRTYPMHWKGFGGCSVATQTRSPHHLSPRLRDDTLLQSVLIGLIQWWPSERLRCSVKVSNGVIWPVGTVTL